MTTLISTLCGTGAAGAERGAWMPLSCLMAGPLFLARLSGGPRDGQRVTITAGDDGEPSEMIEVPDRAGVAVGTSRYRLSYRDNDRGGHVYIYQPMLD